MKCRSLVLLASVVLASVTLEAHEAQAYQVINLPPVVAYTFNVEITNGSATEMSSAVAYTTAGAQSAAAVGTAPTPGFIELCLNGPTQARYNELAANPQVQQSLNLAAAPTHFGLLQPGQSESFQITLVNPAGSNLHVEMMYGKSQDVCSVINIPSDTLNALAGNLKSDAIGSDQVVATGAYFDPALPSPGTSGATACKGQPDARSCLRSLSALNIGAQKIRSFPGYLPSVLTALEEVYGSAATQELIFPTSGSIQYRVTLASTFILRL